MKSEAIENNNTHGDLQINYLKVLFKSKYREIWYY